MISEWESEFDATLETKKDKTEVKPNSNKKQKA